MMEENNAPTPAAEVQPEEENTPTVDTPEVSVTAPDSATAETEVPVTETEAPIEEKAPTEAETPAAEASVAEIEMEAPVEAETPVAEVPVPQTKTGIIERLKELGQKNGTEIVRAEIDALRIAYYRIAAQEALEAREAYLAGGGEADAFVPPVDKDEEEFKASYNTVRLLRAKANEEAENERQENLKRKLAIIEQIKAMVEEPEGIDKKYDSFKALQTEWKEIKAIPQDKSNEVWKNYQHYVEQFYDLLRLNHEFRNYDFKKNLEAKTRLCEVAEKLTELPDAISAFYQLQNLHNEFREIGPVSKELREEIWQRFKTASTTIYKRYQDHFENLKAHEMENLAKKTALCEQLEAIDTATLKSYQAWENAAKKIQEMQAEWRTIGRAPRQKNNKIYERFRAACDKFFSQKSEFTKTTREAYTANLRAKEALCEQAEALKDSEEWQATTNKIQQLQQEWKAIGPVQYKLSNAIWKRFHEACEAFFARKNEAQKGQRLAEEAALAKKQAVITALEEILQQSAGSDTRNLVHEQIQAWHEAGHVPFRKKDKINAMYRALLDRIDKELHISFMRRYFDNSRRGNPQRESNEPRSERDKLVKAYEAKKQEIQNYETNLSFFTSKSASGNSLMADLEKKIDLLRQDLAAIKEKITALEEQPEAE